MIVVSDVYILFQGIEVKFCSMPSEAKKFVSSQKTVQTESETHPTSYTNGIGGSFPFQYVKPTTYRHLMPMLRLRTAIPPIPQ